MSAERAAALYHLIQLTDEASLDRWIGRVGARATVLPVRRPPRPSHDVTAAAGELWHRLDPEARQRWMRNPDMRRAIRRLGIAA